MTDWKNIFKVKIANADPSFLKHEIVKLIIVHKLLYKYKKDKNKIKIYTEFKLENNLKADVYFENLKTKDIIAFEIQKNCNQRYIDETVKKYNELEIPFFNSIDLIIIPLKELSDNLETLSKQLDKYIF